MMKILCLLAVTVYAAYAAPAGELAFSNTTEKKEIIPVLKFETDKKPDGSFRFVYEGGDKSFREESGVVENAGTDDEALEVSGSYRYIDADGREIEVHYTAGKNGFVPVGTNILSEITALAKAAADLPDYHEEENEAETKRKARSKTIEKESANVKKIEAAAEKPKVEEVKKSNEKAEESKIIEIKVDSKTAEKVEEKKPANTETK